MPQLFCKTPNNIEYSRKNSSYRKYINFRESKLTSVQRQLTRGGLASYEPDVQAAVYAFCELTTRRIIFYDIGAHIGFFSIMISTIFRSKNPYIFAFEPTPQTADINRDIRDNNDLAYSVISKGISSRAHKAEFYLSPISESSNSLSSSFRGGNKSINVEITTIDQFVDDGHVEPSMIKIDVETLEYSVLVGGFDTIRKYKPFILCEILNGSNKEATLATLCCLEALGYNFYRLDDKISWIPMRANKVIEVANSKYPDWVFTTQKISTKFTKSFRAWREALKVCDAGSNIIVKRGEKPPNETEDFV